MATKYPIPHQVKKLLEPSFTQGTRHGVALGSATKSLLTGVNKYVTWCQLWTVTGIGLSACVYLTQIAPMGSSYTEHNNGTDYETDPDCH